jgi:Uma2 family endonuclease
MNPMINAMIAPQKSSTQSTTPIDGLWLSDFLEQQVPHEFDLLKGIKVFRMATVAGHGNCIQVLFLAIWQFLQAHSLGEILQECTFILADQHNPTWVKGSRTPDLMFYEKSRYDAYIQNQPDWKDMPFALIPDLVIEVVSPNDSYSLIEEKVEVYLADGVKAVWVVDPKRRRANIYQQNQIMLRLGENDSLNGDDIIAGFSLSLSRLFA